MKKTISGKEFLEKVKSNRDNKYELYKNILKQSYPELFVGGFQIKHLDERLEHLTVEEKAQILEHVIDAIESDLMMNSSLERNLTFFKNVRSTEKTMREFTGAS